MRAGLCRSASAIGVALSGLYSCTMRAQTPEPPASAGTEATAERVIVTGSNIPTAEEVGPNPVDTYRPEDIRKLGARNPSDFVVRLPIATGTAANDNGNEIGVVDINLRGIFKETLVLLDGRRLAPYAWNGGVGVDANTILALGLIDHIDILRDGASAIYGSDAVTGVFNVYYKHKFRGLELYGSIGNTNLDASNDMREVDAYLLAGTGDDKTDIVIYAEDYDRAGIASRDRDISSTANFRRFGGRDTRSGTFSGRIDGFVLRPGLNAPAAAPHSIAGSGPADDPADYVPRNSLNPNSDFFAFNFAEFTQGVAPADRQYFYGSMERDICDKWLRAFADFKYVRTFYNDAIAPPPFVPDPFSIGPGISVPIQNAYNPFTVPDTVVDGMGYTTNVRYRAVEAGARVDEREANNYLFDSGLRGELSDLVTNDLLKTWGYEFGFRYNRDDRHEHVSGVVSSIGLRNALLSTDPATAFDPFARGAAAAHNLRLPGIFITTNRNAVTDLTLEDAKFYGDLVKLPGGPISFALGGEHRKETIDDEPDALVASGQVIGGQNFQPIHGTRDVWAAYGELRIPITSPSWNFRWGLYSLEFQAAERYENFSDFGETEKPKFSVRWQQFDSSLTIRGTYSEAFHAPQLSEIFTSQATVPAEIIDPAGLTPEFVTLILGGNPNLRSENAYEWSYGIVWSPKWLQGLTLSADWYHIDLRDITGTLNPQFVVDTNWSTRIGTLPNGAPVGGLFQDQIIRNSDGSIVSIISTTQNLSRIIEEGLDYEAIYQLDTSIFGHGDWGRVTFTLNGTYLSRYELQSNPAVKRMGIAGQFLGS